MSHEIEADFREDWPDEAKQCRHCTSFRDADGYCSEAKAEVPATAHCDYFQARD